MRESIGELDNRYKRFLKRWVTRISKAEIFKKREKREEMTI